MKLSARNKALLPGMIFIMIGIIFVMRFGAMILVLTIIPSIVAYFIDHQKNRPTFKIIAACNISAALPFIVPIIDFSLKGQYSEAGLVMDDAMIWAFIYCSAAAGWAMIFLAKLVSRTITLMHYEYSVNVLEKKQEILLKEWGEEIIPKTQAKGRKQE